MSTDPTTVRRITFGRPRASLAIVPRDRLDAGGTRLRLRALHVMGHGSARIARALGTLARWLARQREGNRNAGLYWAANRALEADPAADLSPLADAARQAGLGDREITRTLDSARRTRQPDRQAEEMN